LIIRCVVALVAASGFANCAVRLWP